MNHSKFWWGFGAGTVCVLIAAAFSGNLALLILFTLGLVGACGTSEGGLWLIYVIETICVSGNGGIVTEKLSSLFLRGFFRGIFYFAGANLFLRLLCHGFFRIVS